MSQPTERIEVRKIYVGSAMKFGLLYGLVFGIILGIVFLVGGLVAGDVVGSSIGYESGLSLSVVFVGAFIILASHVLFGLVGMVLTALVYNLVSKMGGKLHLGLAEHEENKSVILPQSSI